MSLGANIETHMRARGWSLNELSRAARVQYSTLYELVVTGKQKSIQSDRLKRLAVALNVSCDALLNDDTADTAPPSEETADAGTSVRTASTVGARTANEVPPRLARTLARYGQVLSDADWEKVVIYIRGLAHAKS